MTHWQALFNATRYWGHKMFNDINDITGESYGDTEAA